MEIENLIRSTPCAVGLKPSATRGEARLRGLNWQAASAAVALIAGSFRATACRGGNVEIVANQQFEGRKECINAVAGYALTHPFLMDEVR